MPAPSLSVTVREVERSLDRLRMYRSLSGTLAPTFQHLIAEVILLRVSAILELAIEELACKLVAGASYINGTYPALLYAANSVAGARLAINTRSGPKPPPYLTWTRASDIRRNVSKVLNVAEPFVYYARAHGTILNEIRMVRNGVAHNSANAKSEFRGVIRTTYGANVSLTVGAFLTSTTRRPVAKIDEYLAGTRVIVGQLARG